MNKRAFKEAFNTVFHNKRTFDDFCSLDLSCEINTFTTNDGRLIYRPSDKLKDYLRFIDRVVFRNLAKDADVVHSFIKGKSTLTAVQAHSQNKYFFVTDICDFYLSVKSTNVMHIAKQRAKLSRILGKKALKSFHPRLFNDRLFAGDTWSDKNGCHTRNQTSALC